MKAKEKQEKTKNTAPKGQATVSVKASKVRLATGAGSIASPPKQIVKPAPPQAPSLAEAKAELARTIDRFPQALAEAERLMAKAKERIDGLGKAAANAVESQRYTEVVLDLGGQAEKALKLLESGTRFIQRIIE